jgi:hypothetical protein
MAQNRTCNLSVTGRPSSPLRHVFKVPPDSSHQEAASSLSAGLHSLRQAGVLWMRQRWPLQSSMQQGQLAKQEWQQQQLRQNQQL